MKQLIQSYRTGELGVFEVPAPGCPKRGALIETSASLVSAGTEKMLLELARKSLIGKARARPDLVRQVFDKMRREGVRNTLEKVFTKLDTPIPLGYSCAGRVLEVGEEVAGLAVGDRVACGGAGYANHGEINAVPRNLLVKVPDAVEDIEAAFVTVGAIALQGVRQAGPRLGEVVAVIGLGLIGQLTAQLLKANGCRVVGSDPDPDKRRQADQSGIDRVCAPEQLIEAAAELSRGHGVDATIVCASTASRQPVIDAGSITRAKGRVVVVGVVGLEVPRDLYYRKELDLRLSMSYGPGRYDPQYEEQGLDYPYPHVRWTEQRNFEAFLGLVADRKVNPRALVTHRFDFAEALSAYALLEGKSEQPYLGIVLIYGAGANGEAKRRRSLELRLIGAASDAVRIGCIGAGNFARAMLLPKLSRMAEVELRTLVTATGISARAAGAKFGFARIATDAEEVFGDETINTVLIATRHNSHGPLVARALAAGKHVFVEKPLCLTRAELEGIRAAAGGNGRSGCPQDGSGPAPRQPAGPADSAGPKASDRAPGAPGILMVGFNRRFSPFVRRIKQELGERPAALVYRVNAGVIPGDVWIQDRAIGGGRIIGEVCHFIDTCVYLAGSLPRTVQAACVRQPGAAIPDEDNVNILLGFENGSTAAIHYFAYGHGKVPKETLEVFADGFCAQLNDFRELTLYRQGARIERLKDRNQDKGFQAELEAFFHGVRTGLPPIPLESLCAVTAATFQVLEALRGNERVGE